MQYVKEHKKLCLDLLQRAKRHVKEHDITPTYLCRKAGVQIHAFKVLESGTATPKTMQLLSDYLDVVEKPDAA